MRAGAQIGSGKWRSPRQRDHVPVQVRHHVAQRGQVDLVGRQDGLLGFLDHVHGLHQQLAAMRRQAGHLGQVAVPDHAGEAGVVGVVDLDDAQVRAAPQQRAAVFLAQRTVGVAGAHGVFLRIVAGMRGTRMRVTAALAILDEAGTVGDAVVQLHGGGVGLVGQPVHARGIVGGGLGIDVFDQLAARAGAARLGRHVQVLQIAIVAGGPGGAVEDPVDHADGLAAVVGQRHVHGLGRVEQAIPGVARDGVGDVDAVEVLVALPQRQPDIEVGGGGGADFRGAHGQCLRLRISVGFPVPRRCGAAPAGGRSACRWPISGARARGPRRCASASRWWRRRIPSTCRGCASRRA